MIGIISDTHDNIEAVKKAVDFFNKNRVELVLHAGDYVAPFTAEPFKNLKMPMKGVYGNNDGDLLMLQKKYEGTAEIYPGWIELKELGKKIFLTHIPFPQPPEDADLYVYGHTHEPEVSREGKTLIVNPGDCSGWVSNTNTVALADLKKKEAEIIEL